MRHSASPDGVQRTILPDGLGWSRPPKAGTGPTLGVGRHTDVRQYSVLSPLRASPRAYRGDVPSTTSTTSRPLTGPESAALLVLWAVTGLLGVVTVAGMLTIGLFVAPFAAALLVLAIVLTVRRPGSWPAVAGLGLAMAACFVGLGLFLGSAGPSQGSCAATPDGVETCTSGGLAYDPDAFRWSTAVPWFAAAALVTALTLVAYVALRRVTTGWVRSP